jgi:hypothetical protein
MSGERYRLTWASSFLSFFIACLVNFASVAIHLSCHSFQTIWPIWTKLYAVMMFVRFSTNLTHFVLFWQFLFLIGWNLKNLLLWSPNDFLFGLENVCEVLYRKSWFCFNSWKNMAVMGNSGFWLPESLQMKP